MDSKENAKEYTFWNLLQEYQVEIPIIQRDYAQGRKNKVELRQHFLNDLREAISKEDDMELHFVYSTEIKSSSGQTVIAPLDGQQRLTTLWLLHWYLAVKTGILASSDVDNDDEAKKTRAILRKFTYKTRISSRDFCEALCNKSFKKDETDLVGYICNQTWFRSFWKQDPTIQSMLCMLKGTSAEKKDGTKDQNNDGIEQIFVGSDCEKYWRWITSDSCKVRFHHLDLVKLKLSDDLYIKMNARGKFLSSFDNFKADFIGYISNLNSNNDYLDPENGIPLKFDTTWASIFWNENKEFWKGRQKDENESEEKTRLEFNIDVPYFTFFNRLFFDAMMITMKEANEKDADGAEDVDEVKYLFSGVDLEKHPSFKYLMGPWEGNQYVDNKIEYAAFDKYCFEKISKEGEDDCFVVPENVFNRIQNVLDNATCIKNESVSECFPKRHQHDRFKFIPQLDDSDGDISVYSISQTYRVIFSAICDYLSYGEFDKDSFTRWMRICWNILDESDIDSVSAMVTRARRIHSIAKGSHDIINYLSCHKEFGSKEQQLEEERQKAIWIKEGDNLHENLSEQDREENIINLENYSFFDGSIRFLIRDSEGHYGENGWKEFDAKSEFAKANLESSLTTSKDATLLKKLLSRFDETDFARVLWWSQRRYNNKKETWRYYLLNEKMHSILHDFLLDKPITERPEPVLNEDTRFKYYIYHLSHGGLLDFVVKEIPNSWVRWYHGHDAVFPSGTGVFLTAQKRDNFFDSNKAEVSVNDKHIVQGSKFLYGIDISFTFKGNEFIWNEQEKIVPVNDASQAFTTKELNDEQIIERMKGIVSGFNSETIPNESPYTPQM